MPAVTAAALERLNAFPIAGTVLFKHYFAGDDVFDRLRPYYNGNQNRVEVPVGEFDSLRRSLLEQGYDVSVVDRPAEFYVVVRQYSEHPEDIFKSSIRHEHVDGYNCFLMKDRETVEAAVAQGATPSIRSRCPCPRARSATSPRRRREEHTRSPFHRDRARFV